MPRIILFYYLVNTHPLKHPIMAYMIIPSVISGHIPIKRLTINKPIRIATVLLSSILTPSSIKIQTQKKGIYLISSIQKPPLPSFSIVSVRPAICCIDFFGFHKRRCDKINKEIDEANNKALTEFHEQLDTWKRSQSKMLTLNKTPELNAEINIE